MPRKGRHVELRHLFPWVAAPYIEFLRLLLRIERLLLSPFQYLQAWTVSAVFGIAGILLSVALFIPRLAGNQAVASSSQLVGRFDMPYIPPEDLALPEPSRSTDPPQVTLNVERTIVRDFDQNERILTESQPLKPTRPRVALRDDWSTHIHDYQDHTPLSFQPYIRRAAIYDSQLAHLIPEYHFDSGVGDFQTKNIHSANVTVRKSVPHGNPDEPLTYIITVSNAGSESIGTTTVEEAVSNIQRVIDTDPPAQVSPTQDRLIWELTELLPDETRHLKVTIQPDRRHLMKQDTTVVFSTAPVIAETMVRAKAPEALPEVLPAEPEPEPEPEPAPQPVPLPVQPTVTGTPRLVIEFDPPPTVRVGEEVRAYYTITNVGTADATGIRLLVEVPPELKHRFGELVEHKISRLEPNESRKALFAALAQDKGRMSLNWTLECDELENQSSSEWLAVNPPITPLGTPKSSIPNTEPTPLDAAPIEPTLNEPLSTWPQPRPTFDNPRTIPPRGVPFGPQPAPGSSIPSTIPSTIPHWVDPSAVTPPDSNDWQGREPIVPDIAPDEPMGLGPVSPPDDLPSLESEGPAVDAPPVRSTIPNGPAVPDLIPSMETVPPDSLPTETAPEFPAEQPQPQSEPEAPPTEAKFN